MHFHRETSRGEKTQKEKHRASVLDRKSIFLSCLYATKTSKNQTHRFVMQFIKLGLKSGEDKISQLGKFTCYSSEMTIAHVG